MNIIRNIYRIVSSYLRKSHLVKRAKHGSWQKYRAVLDKVPDVEPEEDDKL